MREIHSKWKNSAHHILMMMNSIYFHRNSHSVIRWGHVAITKTPNVSKCFIITLNILRINLWMFSCWDLLFKYWQVLLILANSKSDSIWALQYWKVNLREREREREREHTSSRGLSSKRGTLITLNYNLKLFFFPIFSILIHWINI